jgi:glycosidase
LLTYNTSDKRTLHLPDWAKDRVIYEVNIRQLTPEGTFNAFLKHLPRLKEMEVGILWLMPVFPISMTKRKGPLGSYYSVSDYCSVNPEFGSQSDFKQLVDTAHALDLRVIIDWVPNHTGWDHKWLTEHPEFYTRNEAGEITEPLDGNGNSLGWSDVADLNYANQQMRSAMVEAMAWWIREFDIDGFRQDMALLVPDDFWLEANHSLQKIKKNLFFLAESENHELIRQQAFHAVYGWGIHHLINTVATGKSTVRQLDDWCRNAYVNNNMVSSLLFTSNHDENAWSGSEIERMGEAYKAFAVLMNTLPGYALMYCGQEEPVCKRISFFEKDAIDFKYFKHASFYKILHMVRKTCPAIWNGPDGGVFELTKQDDRVFSFRRHKGTSCVYVIINLTKIGASFTTDQSIDGDEIFTDKRVNFNAGDEIKLKPWEYKVIIQNQR